MKVNFGPIMSLQSFDNFAFYVTTIGGE